MKKFIKNESGRSMVEMLGVLAIIALLSVGTIVGYSYLVQRHRRLEAVSQVEQVVVALNTTDALRRYDAGEVVKLGEVIKGPEIVNDKLKLPTGEDDYLVVTAMEGGQFALALEAQPDVCQAILDSFTTTKNVVLTDAPATTDRRVRRSPTKEGLRSNKSTPEEWKAAVISACAGPAGAVFNCSEGSISYGYDYGIFCKGCPESKPFYDGYECCEGPGKGNFCGGLCGCRDGKVCDKEKDACVVCTTTGPEGQLGGDKQCWKAYDNKFPQHVCKQSNNTCVECLKHSDCSSDLGPRNPNSEAVWCVREKCIPCLMSWQGGSTLADGECGESRPLCKEEGCRVCPEGLVYDPRAQDCVCPAGTIKNPNTEECVKCYDSNKGTDMDAGCDETAKICDETGSTVIDGRTYKGKCINCVNDSNCPTSTPNWYCCLAEMGDPGAGQKTCSPRNCEECPADHPYFNYEKNIRQCYKCIDDVDGDNPSDTGCESGDLGTAKRLCERTSATNKYGNSCHVCQNTQYGTQQASQDLGCTSDKKLCGTNTEKGFAEVCYKCTDDKTGAEKDSGCSDETPICVVDGMKSTASGAFGNSCTKCINDKEGATSVDTGCNDAKPMCLADQGQAGSECTACPPGTIPNPKTGECVYCYDSDASNATTDKGCDTPKPHCDETQKTTVDGKEYKGACFLCNGHYGSGATLPCGQDKPYCKDKMQCLTCPEVNAARPIWNTEKQDCFMCVDDKANVGTDSGCRDSERLCSDTAGSAKYATGNTKDALNDVCYQCITDKNCTDLNIGKNICSNHVCVDCGTDSCIDHNGNCIPLSRYIDIKRGNDGRCECYNTLKSVSISDSGNSYNCGTFDKGGSRLTSSRQRYYKVPKNPSNFYCKYKFRANGYADDWVVSSLSDGIGRNSKHDSWKEAHDNSISPQYADHKVQGNGQQKQIVVEDRWLAEVGYSGDFRFEIESAPGDTRHSGTKSDIKVDYGWNNGGKCDNVGRWRDKK